MYCLASLWCSHKQIIKVFNPCPAEPDLSCFDNSVDPDQRASDANQYAHCFPFCLKVHAYKWNATG